MVLLYSTLSWHGPETWLLHLKDKMQVTISYVICHWQHAVAMVSICSAEFKQSGSRNNGLRDVWVRVSFREACWRIEGSSGNGNTVSCMCRRAQQHLHEEQHSESIPFIPDNVMPVLNRYNHEKKKKKCWCQLLYTLNDNKKNFCQADWNKFVEAIHSPGEKQLHGQ